MTTVICKQDETDFKLMLRINHIKNQNKLLNNENKSGKNNS